jgi:hypothetical protein
MVDSSRMVFINTPNNLHQQLGVYQKNKYCYGYHLRSILS